MRRTDWPRDVYTSSDDEVTTRIDTSEWADTKWASIEAHASQHYGPPFRRLYESGAFAYETYVRVHPTFLPGESVEHDLLAGLE